jgi:mono/diheme cytochrome c family protein
MTTWRAAGLTVIAVFVFGLGSVFLFLKGEGLSAQHKPSNFEYAIANFALAQSIPASSKNATNPLQDSKEALSRGRQDFHDNCAVCHGDDGVGKTATASGMSPEVPDLHAQHVQKWTDGELFYSITNGIRFTAMPGWNLDEDRIWSLVRNVRTFRLSPTGAQSAKRQ